MKSSVRFRDPPLYRNRGRNIDRAEKLQSYLTINRPLVQRWFSRNPFYIDRDCWLCCSLSSLQKSSDRPRRTKIISCMNNTTHCRSRFNYPMWSAPWRRNTTYIMRDTEAHWLLRLPHVKINICFSKMSISLERTCTWWYFSYITMTHGFVIVVLLFFIYV